MIGYEQLAHLTTECPELLILRRFDRLGARMLLRQQAELLYLEGELEAATAVDEKDDPELSTYWGKAREVGNSSENSLQVNKLDQIEQKLKIYRRTATQVRVASKMLTERVDETVLRLRDIRQLSKPSQQNKSALWKWLCSQEGGNNFLQHIEAGPWECEKVSELLSLVPQSDRLDGWLMNAITPLYYNVLGHRRKPDLDTESGLGTLWLYREKQLHWIGDVLCVILSSAIPIASIQGLYWIPSTVGRLSLITAFIVIFCYLLMFVAGCRRSEVFAGTSAFAAVLVVFLQGLEGVVNCATLPTNTNR